MNFNNIIVTNNEEKIVYLGKNILRYVNTSTLEPFSYPQGQIEKDDVFILIVNDASLLSDEEYIFVETVVRKTFPRQGKVLVIGKFENEETECILKTIKNVKNENKDKNIILLNTVFNGIPIKVYCNINTKVLSVEFDKQKIINYYTYCNEMVIIANENGIKYFKNDKAQNHDRFSEILKKKTYSHFINKSLIFNKGINISDLFIQPFVEKMIKLNPLGDRCVITFKKHKILIERIYDANLEREFKIWSIMCEKDILAGMKDDSDSYCILHSTCNTLKTTDYSFKLWGDDTKMARIRYLLQKSCGTNTTILITGESGTGKSCLAKEIHKNSRRYNFPFIHVNCASIPYNLLESELFGYEDGAFTGAKRGGKSGYFELADGGTLFLDEITEIPMAFQGKLLEAIQSKTFYRVGGEKKKRVDIRLIAATNKNLKKMVKESKFRKDLFYRINVFPIELPPLRDRSSELFSIITDILPDICDRVGVKQLILSLEALGKIKNYKWPGNIRELENVLEKACILADGKMIMPEDIYIENEQTQKQIGVTLRERRELFEKEVIKEALEKFSGERSKTADYLGIGRTSLFEKIRKYNLN